LDIWNVPEFRAGLAAGLVASGFAILAGVALAMFRRGRPFPVAGLAFAAAGLWSIADFRNVPGLVVVGVIGVGAAAGLGAIRQVPALCVGILAVPFGALIGFRGGVIDLTWARVLVTVAASFGGVLAAYFDATWRREAIAPGLLALTVAGTYFAVPDTEEAAALVGVVVPLTALGWPVRVFALGRSGAACAVATIVWAGAIGGRGAPVSIIGVVACLGLLVALPVSQIISRPPSVRGRPGKGR
jgi:hypothetical protein